MNVSSVLHEGINGIKRSQQGVLESANKVAKANIEIKDTEPAVYNSHTQVVEPIIEMKVHQYLFDASAKVVKTADEVVGTLLKAKA